MAYVSRFVRALLVEGNPKDVNTGLRGEPDTHWNLILPQIICYIVVLKVLKLRRARSAAVISADQALSEHVIAHFWPNISLIAHVTSTRVHDKRGER